MIIFLQNAWSPFYAGRVWARHSWINALKRSRSGQRLAILTDDYGICHNTTPQVGATPSSKLPPDREHIQSVLEDEMPRIIVACGKQAEEYFTNNWNGDLLCVPHPACRVLTNNLYYRAKELLEGDFYGQWALRQLKGSIKEEKL
jgi:hypothetical protein